LEKRTYSRGQYVVREGDPVTMVYIIRNGEFELQKRLILEAKTNKKEEHQIEEEV
jgi:CRP-like cAMP-binding protein